MSTRSWHMGTSSWLREWFAPKKSQEFSNQRCKTRGTRPARRCRLELERLEDRLVPANLQLISHADPSWFSDSATGASLTVPTPGVSVSLDGRFAVFVS